MRSTAFGKITAVYGDIGKSGALSVNLDEILDELVEQCRLLKKMIVFRCKNQRNTLQIQSQIDRLHSVFHLIQARNGKIFPVSFLV